MTINVSVLKIGVTIIDKSTQFQIWWKRGKQQNSPSEVYELNPEKKMITPFYDFSRDSSFYQKGESWEKKDCVFSIHTCQNGHFKKISELEVDMSSFVNKYNKKSRVDFPDDPKSNLKGVFLELSWNIRDPKSAFIKDSPIF